MADTFTTSLKVRLPQTGAYNNTWGSVLNADALNLLDDAITGQSAIVLSGTTYSLPALANGVDADSRSFCLRFTGAPGSAVTVTVPGTVTKKFYLVDNACGQPITFTYVGSSTTATIANGEKRFVWCDGVDCFAPSAQASDATTLDGLDSTVFARRDVENIYVDRWSSPWVTVTEAPTTTIDASVGNHQKLTLTGNRVMAAPTNVVDGQPLVLMVIQDGTGSRTLTWNSVFVFESGLTPTLAASPGAIDLFMMFYDNALTKWIVGHFGSIAAASGATYNLIIEDNAANWRLIERLGSVGGAATVNVTVAAGVWVHSTTTATAAMDLSGLPSGSTVNLFNLGLIEGRAGDGGDGSTLAMSSVVLDGFSASAGYAGGNAITGPGSGINFNVTNANGRIWAGGGGGGGGGSTVSANEVASGGGGGGGAGAGRPGRAGRRTLNLVTNYAGADGTFGSVGYGGTFGTGGAGNGNSAGGGTGGNGGDYGAAGSAGTSPTSGTNDTPGGAGGAAGLAIQLLGGSVTFLSGSGSPNTKGAVS